MHVDNLSNVIFVVVIVVIIFIIIVYCSPHDARLLAVAAGAAVLVWRLSGRIVGMKSVEVYGSIKRI